MANFNVAVVGCGRIGAQAPRADIRLQPVTHAAAWEGCPGATLVALVDPNSENLQRAHALFPRARTYANISQLFARERPDVVSIATPTPLHHETLLVIAAHRPKAILCEKPLALTISDAEEMVRVCRERGILLFVNHHRHFDPLLNRWANRAREGVLGDLLQGDAYYYNGLFNSGTHMIDLISLFVGLPKSVTARYNQRTTKDIADRNVDAMLRFDNGTTMSMHSLTPDYGVFDLRLFGDKGLLAICDVGFTVRYYKKISNQFFKGYFGLAEPKISGGLRSMFAGVARHVVAALRGKAQPIGTGDDALRVMRALRALQESADNDGKEIIVQ